MVDFVKHFYASIEMILWYMSFINIIDYINWVSDIKPTLPSCDKSYLVIAYNQLYLVRFGLLIFCRGFLVSTFMKDIGLWFSFLVMFI